MKTPKVARGYFQVFGLVLLILLSFIGCENLHKDRQSGFSRTNLGKMDFDRAYDICERVMRTEFGQVKLDRQKGAMHAGPIYFNNNKDTISLRGQEYRRLANLKLQKEHHMMLAYIQVRVERQDYQVYKQFQTFRTERDYAIATPMEADTMAPWAQRQVWTKLRRDHKWENKIAARIRQELAIYDQKNKTNANQRLP